MDEQGNNVLHLRCQTTRHVRLIDITLQVIDLVPESVCSQKALDGNLRGQAPLHIVASGRDVEDRRHIVIQRLVGAKASMEDVNLYGATPLLVAAGAGYRWGAETLHRLGANMLATLPDGRNFADLAKNPNKSMEQWWCRITKNEATSTTKQNREGTWRGEGLPEKRQQTMVEERVERGWDDRRQLAARGAEEEEHQRGGGGGRGVLRDADGHIPESVQGWRCGGWQQWSQPGWSQSGWEDQAAGWQDREWGFRPAPLAV
jgi:hypothetical protein